MTSSRLDRTLVTLSTVVRSKSPNAQTVYHPVEIIVTKRTWGYLVVVAASATPTCVMKVRITVSTLALIIDPHRSLHAIPTLMKYQVQYLLGTALLFALVSGCVIGSDCRSNKKRNSRYDNIDGGYVMREECFLQSDACWIDCETRNASTTCVGCCRDQYFLCNTQQPYSFESCKSTR